jgi:hypothetical protein
MNLSELVTPVGTRIFHTLTGRHDEDMFLTVSDMSSAHWELLMGCYHTGECDDDCEEAAKYFELQDYSTAKSYLTGCGIEKEGLQDDESILKYYLWWLSGDIQEP